MVEVADPFLVAMADNNHIHSYSHRHSEYPTEHEVPANDISARVQKLSLSSNPFRDVPSSSYLLLLTPYLHKTPTGLPSTSGIDPFEPFGRNLTQYHSRIRHVPYVAKHGVIDIHRQHVATAGGVIVLTCPTESSGLEDGEMLDHIDDQIAFAENISDLVKRADVPALFVTVGELDQDQIHFGGPQLHVDSWTELATAAELVYNAS
jgi:hypothetical protein